MANDYIPVSLKADPLYKEAVKRLADHHHVNMGVIIRRALDNSYGEEIERELKELKSENRKTIRQMRDGVTIPQA